MITLENRFLTLQINRKGGEWTSLLDKERHEELLYQVHPDSWQRQAPLLFPIVGALIDNKYIHFGELFELNQHGFLRDMELDVVSLNKKSVTLSLTYNAETYKVYPFEFRVFVTYILRQNKVITQLEVLNLGDQPMYFNIGGHPAFKIDHQEENKLKLSTQKKAGQFILEGPFVSDYRSLKEKEIDLREVDLNGTLILDGVKKVVLETPHREIKLSMKPAKWMGFWSAKNNQTQDLQDMICLEPWWGIADCIDSDQHLRNKKGIITLNPEETKSFSYTIEIKNKQIAPLAIGPYALSQEHNGLVFVSGQLPLNPLNNEIEHQDITEQTRQSLLNVKSVLALCNLSLSDVLKTTIYLKDMNDFTAMNEVYGEYFKDPYPARSTVEVSRLPKDALIEIEVVAKNTRS